MQKKCCSLLLGLVIVSLAQVTSSTSPNEVFTSSFLVRFKKSVDSNEAHEIAKRNSFVNLGAVSKLWRNTVYLSPLSLLRQLCDNTTRESKFDQVLGWVAKTSSQSEGESREIFCLAKLRADKREYISQHMGIYDVKMCSR